MLIIDGFAGGGGASTGIEMALGRSPDYAVNHSEVALSMHEANHPDTTHLVKNIWHVDPAEIATRGEPVGLAWFSPDCKHHSKAKGGKPLKRNIRDLGWVTVLWADRAKPVVIMLENVEEFQQWGPLMANDKPDPDRKGETFKKMIKELRRHGYKVEWRELRACDYGAPTIRKRLFMVARRDGKPIVWPKQTHGKIGSPAVLKGKLEPWKSAASIIDFSLPCPSIFDTSKEIKERYGLRAVRPLADNTLERVARGIDKYVINNAAPFIVPITHTTSGPRVEPIDEPLRTITTAKGGERMLAVPKLMKADMVAAFMAQHNLGAVGRKVDEPLATITTRGTQIQLVSAHLMSLKGTSRRDSSIAEPLPTVCAGGTHAALVYSFMMKYYGQGTGSDLREPCHSVTTRDRFGLITVLVNGVTYAITDIGMRMLTPRELFCAQGFPRNYKIEYGASGERLTKTEQISMCGNSVPPPVAEALVQSNCGFLTSQWNAA